MSKEIYYDFLGQELKQSQRIIYHTSGRKGNLDSYVIEEIKTVNYKPQIIVSHYDRKTTIKRIPKNCIVIDDIINTKPELFL